MVRKTAVRGTTASTSGTTIGEDVPSVELGARSIYEYMESLECNQVGSSVDAITITATSIEGKAVIDSVLVGLENVLRDEKVKKFSFWGANGWSRGSVRYADKTEGGRRLWCILMITGLWSESVLKNCIGSNSVKFTRVDVAVDVKLKRPDEKVARKIRDYGEKFTNGQVKLVESLVGGTVYVGSRESDKFFRIYDKSADYGEDIGRIWRFELEAKGEFSETVRLAIRENGSECVADILWDAARSMGIPSPAVGSMLVYAKKQVTLPSSEMKLAWLQRQVRPTVVWLSKVWGVQVVQEALGLPVSEGDITYDIGMDNGD